MLGKLQELLQKRSLWVLPWLSRENFHLRVLLFLTPQGPLGTTCGAELLWDRRIDRPSAVRIWDGEQRSMFVKSHPFHKCWRNLLIAFWSSLICLLGGRLCFCFCRASSGAGPGNFSSVLSTLTCSAGTPLPPCTASAGLHRLGWTRACSLSQAAIPAAASFLHESFWGQLGEASEKTEGKKCLVSYVRIA